MCSLTLRSFAEYIPFRLHNVCSSFNYNYSVEADWQSLARQLQFSLVDALTGAGVSATLSVIHHVNKYVIPAGLSWLNRLFSGRWESLKGTWVLADSYIIFKKHFSTLHLSIIWFVLLLESHRIFRILLMTSIWSLLFWIHWASQQHLGKSTVQKR